MVKKEWQLIWKDKKFALSIMVMCFMPILYAGMLLYAFWDPYDRLNELPVAIVNEDQGAELQGEAIDLGRELTDELLGNKDLNFIQVEAADAEQRLLDEDYYLLVRIPSNFSQHATTLLDDEPKKLELEYVVNEGANFLSSQIGGNAIESIRSKVNEEVAKTYATELYEAIAKLGDGYVEAADAASQIQDGAVKLADGSTELKDYLYQLASSTVTLSDGTTTLQQGINKASTGATELASGAANVTTGAAQLQQGMESAADGATTVAQAVTAYTAGVTELVEGQVAVQQGQQQLQEGLQSVAQNSSAIYEGTTGLQAGAANVAAGITQLREQLAAMDLPVEQAAQLEATLTALTEGSTSVATGVAGLAASTEQLAQGTAMLSQSGTSLVTGQTQVVQGLNELAAKAPDLQQGAQSLQQGNMTLAQNMQELTAGTVTLADGASTLRNGLADISAGSTTLSSGTTELAAKSSELAEGSMSLVDGTTELQDGSGELAKSLADAGEEAVINSSDKQIEMTVSPVELKETVYNKVDNYGSGFAPYFISLGLFVGALLLTNVYPYVQPAGHPTGLWRWFASKTSVIAVVGLFQIIFTYGLLVWILGVEVESNMWLLATITIASFSFLAIVQVVTVVLGDVGRFLALIFLIVQLAGSAGTFPLELLPAPLQAVHNFLPMSYSVHALRAAISTNDVSVLTHSLTILGTIGIVSIIISFTFFALLYKRRYSKVQEA